MTVSSSLSMGTGKSASGGAMKRSRRDEMAWVSKKHRPAVFAAAPGGLVPAIAPSSSSSSSSSPIVLEQNGNKGPGVDHIHMEEEKAQPCEFLATAYDGHRNPIIKRSSPTYASLRCLGVTRATPVLAKKLTRTDSNPAQARLQFSHKEFTASPLWSMLQEYERGRVHSKDGLKVEALDRHGRCYDMILGFASLRTGISYRLRRGWTRFLRHSGVREGDLVQVGAFRVHGSELKLTLMDGAITEAERDAADALVMLSDCHR